MVTLPYTKRSVTIEWIHHTCQVNMTDKLNINLTFGNYNDPKIRLESEKINKNII